MYKKIGILVLTLILLIAPCYAIFGTDLFSDGDFIVTEKGTILNVPNGVELKSSNDGIEIYENDYSDFIIVNNDDSDLIFNLTGTFTSGESVGNGVYKTTYQYLGNNFNVWTLAMKEDTLYTTYAKNDTTGEYIFCISKSQNVCDVDKWDIEWDNKESTI